MNKTAIATQFEIDSSKVALTQASSAALKEFASMMISERTAAENMKEAMKPTASTCAAIPATVDEKHQKILDKLENKVDGSCEKHAGDLRKILAKPKG